MTTLYRRSEASAGVPGVAFRLGSTAESTVEAHVLFGAVVADDLKMVITGRPGEPALLEGRFGLWVPTPLAGLVEAGLVQRGHQVTDDVTPS
jgi:hypothetical protein